MRECINVHDGQTTKADCLLWDSLEFHEAVKKSILRDYHCNWSEAPDDVLILAETDDFWWFFWYDRDCSDCCIGRANKANVGISKEELIKLFDVVTTNWDGYTKTSLIDFTVNCKGWIGG